MTIKHSKRGTLFDLTLYHTIPNVDDSKEKYFRKHCEKRRKCWLPLTLYHTIPSFNDSKEKDS